MADILPFRKKPTKPEPFDDPRQNGAYEVYLDWTKNWSREMRALIFPQYASIDNRP